jgi:hypothetical protein
MTADPNPTPTPTEPEVLAPSPFPWRLALLFGAEVLVLSAFQWPLQRFTHFAYCDSGSDITIQALVARGLRPTIDFGYIYGLLPLLIGRAWQAVLGPSPAGCQALALVCNLAMAAGLARFASAARVGPTGVVLIVVAIPDMLVNSVLVLVHVLEPALLVNALASQARGRRGQALALATACLFVKPSMAYLYGFVLLVTIALTERGRWLRVLTPAVVTGLTLAAVLAAVYGVEPMLRALLPGNGMEVYRQSGHGFFRGAGRAFWEIPGGGLRDYLRYEVGAWLAGTAVLGLGGVLALLRVLGRRASRNDEPVLTCAVLHFCFVTLFFGNRFSWAYYYWALVLGQAAMAAWGIRYAAMVAVVAALTLVGSKVKTEMTARMWRTERASAETFGVWASPQERAEWLEVLALAKGRHPVSLLAGVEGATVLTPGGVFEPPVGSYFVPGHTVPSEIRRKAEQLAKADMVVRVFPRGDPSRGGYDRWPEVAAALDGCEVVWQGDLFEVSRRVRPPAAFPPRSGPGGLRRPESPGQRAEDQGPIGRGG